jgi:hypothetical protein
LELPELPDDIDPSVDEQAVAESEETASIVSMHAVDRNFCNFIAALLKWRSRKCAFT